MEYLEFRNIFAMFLYISEKHTWTVLQKLYVILVFILDVTRTLFWICKRLEHFLASNNTYCEKLVGKAVIREMQGGDSLNLGLRR